MVDYLKLIGVVLGVSIGINGLMIKLAYRLGWLDKGGQNRPQDIHVYPVPRFGGVGVLSGILVGVGLMGLYTDPTVRWVIAGMVLMVGVGVLDDLFNINPYVRLVTNTIAAAMVVVFGGVKINYITNPLGGVIHFDSWGDWLPILLSMVWLVWITNVINWSKGVDGQFPGLVSLGLLAVGGLSLRFYPDQVAVTVFYLALMASVAFAGLLVFNIYPQKMMPGYSAGSLGGFLLGIISIMAAAKLAGLFIVMGIPILDGVYAILRRIKAGKSPVWGDDGHLHHLLLKQMGWPKPYVALFYWVTTFVLGLIGLHLRSYQKMFTIALVTILFASFVIWLKRFFITLKPRG